MKIVYCRICGDLLDQIGTNISTCTCKNVAARYWDDGCKMTIAVVDIPDSFSVYGYNTAWFRLQKYKCVFKSSTPVRYYLCLPFIKLFELWTWAMINGRICWRKPLSQTICRTYIAGVKFYTYD